MFATWKYDRDTAEVQNIRLAYDPISARSSQHQACDRCHEKKLKCSGEKDGCDRCISSSHACVYNRSEARCTRRGKRSSRCSNDGSAVDETLSRSGSNSGSPSRRNTQAQQHRVRKGSQSSRRKSTSSSAAHSRSSTEPDVDFTSPRVSAAPSVTGSPYSLSTSFATISESDYAATPCLSSPYDAPGGVSMAQHQHHHHQQQQQHIPYSMPFHDCGYQSGAAWPAAYPRDPSTSAGMSNSYLATVSNPHAFPVLTPPDDYMQFQAFSNMQTAGADIWPYRR